MRLKISHLLLLLAFGLGIPAALSAQDGGEMSVRQFYLAETDLDANTAGTMMYDQNGEVCAIIKLETSLDGFTFDVGSLGVRDVKRVGGELWIYVPFGIRRITLSHPQLGVIRDYQFPVRIERARTYIMKLNAKLGNRVYDNEHRQEFILQVTPADAEVMINGMAVPLDSTGRFSQELAFGLYDVTVQRKDYHTVTFQQQIDNPEPAHFKEVFMKQDYGWLSIPGYNGETVWVDDDRVQYSEGDVLKLKSGHYRIRRKKPLFKLHETAVEIQDSVVFVLDTPEYELYARTVEISVGEGAEIWVDTTKVGDSRWSGLVEYGQHTLYGKKRGHRSTEQMVNVTESGPETVSLASPVPAYGTLSVAVDPAPAEVYVDGSFKGQAPDNYVLPIGDHEVEIRRSGMDTEHFRIDLPEGETIALDVHLITTLTVNLTTYADSTEVKIDGEYIGKTPVTVKIPAGRHRVEAKSDQFKRFDREMDFDNPGTMMLPLKPRYTHKGAFYLDLQAAFPSFYAGAAIGFYAKKFNMEVNALYGLTSSEAIYWNASDASSEPSVYTYKPLVAGARMGLEIPFSMGLALTPQIGANMIMAMGTPQGTSAFDASRATALAAVIDLRFTARLAGPLYVKVEPEYDIKVWQGGLFETIAEASKAVNGWASGFKCSVGFSFIF